MSPHDVWFVDVLAFDGGAAERTLAGDSGLVSSRGCDVGYCRPFLADGGYRMLLHVALLTLRVVLELSRMLLL